MIEEEIEDMYTPLYSVQQTGPLASRILEERE